MSTYVLPQVQVFQSFTTQPVAVANPLRAHIAGGAAWLVRFSDTTELELGRLGFYDDAVDTEYLIPNVPAGALVDPGYTKLWISDALLQ